ncbi:MAG: hypothetical protein M3Y86_13310 [Verrucomicrobiota bacterium]|nr:hypothetical protein [Verrucomicrobiota bacterium]
MKRILLALATAALLIPAARELKAADLSVDFFYNNLGDDGSWVDVADYGYCWQPNVAARNANWRPYTEGSWAYTNEGWTWVSNEDFGWATYHYGRWARLHDVGWVWVPGTEWAPAWVSWRTGGDYVGWAPLPPHRSGGGEPVYEGRPITGRVDLEYDLGPAYYNFVDVRYMGDPVLRERVYAPSRNLEFVRDTVNVTNITYENDRVYNHGPDYDRLSRYSTQPIRRLQIERESNVDPASAVRNHSITKVEGDRLMIASPLRVQKSAQGQAPKTVKRKLEKPELETGWRGISDPQAKAKLQEKFKTEDDKNVPPPNIPPANAAGAKGQPAATASSPAASATASVSPVENAKGDKHRERGPKTTPTAAAAAVTPSASPLAGTTPVRAHGADKRVAPAATAVPTVPPTSTPAAEKAAKKRARNIEQPTPASTPVSPKEAQDNSATEHKKAMDSIRAQQRPKGAKRGEQPVEAVKTGVGPGREEIAPHGPPVNQPPGDKQINDGQEKGGKGKRGEKGKKAEEPTPAPQ